MYIFISVFNLSIFNTIITGSFVTGESDRLLIILFKRKTVVRSRVDLNVNSNVGN